MTTAMAVVVQEPGSLTFEQLTLDSPGAADVVVDVEFSGISTGTERLLWTGDMPPFPGMGYPLVPGYESVGRIIEAGPDSNARIGERVFVPGARCFKHVRGLFGGAASRLVTSSERVVPVSEDLKEHAILLALAATAYHALAAPNARLPDLIVGHGVLGRLLARLAIALGGDPPTVWEQDPQRLTGALGYEVVSPDDDSRSDYRAIYDVSGDSALLDQLVPRLAIRSAAEIVLAGFYPQRLSFAFAPAFMREARLRIAAQWDPSDLTAVNHLLRGDQFSLDGLITHRDRAERAAYAYPYAFNERSCLKMILDWRECP